MKVNLSREIQNEIPFKELLLNFSSQSILNFKRSDPIKLLITNKLTFLKKNNNKKNKFVSTYFNINMLINANPALFKSPKFIAIILEMSNYLKHSKEILDKIKILIISRLIYDLIIKYKTLQNNNNDKKFEKIENEIYQYINDNLNYLDQMKLLKKEKLISMKVEKIYLELMITILKNFNYKKYGQEYNEIVEKLEFETIIFPEYFNKKIIRIINSNKDYIKRLYIKHSSDLFNQEKINYYYIILKYFLKNSIYIYHVKNLLSTKKVVLKIIKRKLHKLLNKEIKPNLIEKIEYLVKVLTDSNYYFMIFQNFLKLKEIFKYYKVFCFQSKKEDIEYIEKNINNIKDKKFYQIFSEKIEKDYPIARKMNERIQIIKYVLFDKNDKVKDLSNYVYSWEKIEKNLNNKLFEQIPKNYTLKLAEYFTDDNNKQELIKIFNNEIYKEIKVKIYEFLNENILLNNKNKNLIKSKEVEPEITSKGNESWILNDKESKNNDNSCLIIESEYILNSSNESNEANFSSQISKGLKNILKFKYVKSIGKHKNSCEFIKQFNNFLLSGGADKELLIYDDSFRKISKITENSSINNLLIDIEPKREIISLFLCTKNGIYLKEYDQDFTNIKGEEEINNVNCFNIIDINSEETLVCKSSNVEKIKYLFRRLLKVMKEIVINGVFKGIIRISENEIALTSNQILSDGKDVLIIYKIFGNTIQDKIEGYSFVNTSNGLTVINREKEKNCVILLCACKKYIQGQENGILLVLNKNLNNEIEKEYKFYETDNFEVYCFCPVVLKENTFIFNDEKNKVYKTNYFFVGGFDSKKQRAKVKLFEFDDEDNLLSINFIKNIEFENIKELKNPITCIIQFKNSENILISCLDGSVHLFMVDLSFLLSDYKVEKIEIKA